MIRLLNVENYEFHSEKQHMCQQQCPYVIISHVWEPNEMMFGDVQESKRAATSHKIGGACQTVLQHYGGKIKHIWLDTVCIDQKNPVELSTSINSMYQWYKQSEACFVYLKDYPTKDVPVFTKSKWFTRGWTLQELVAP